LASNLKYHTLLDKLFEAKSKKEKEKEKEKKNMKL